jgi:tetraacyldisaccharide 4'-kinase
LIARRDSMAWRQALQRHWWQPAPGAWGPVLAAFLLPLSWIYDGLRRLPARRSRPGPLPVPVVIVGNLVVGGAGKTPVVLALVEQLRRAGYRPGIVSRGYRPGVAAADAPRAVTPEASASVCGDEPVLLRRRAKVPVWLGRDRAAAVRALCAAHPEVDVVLSDDGLQHRALARDAQVLVFDGRGAGNGRLLPAGPLREPLPGALPPRTVVVYNAPAPTTALPGHCAQARIGAIVPLADWWAGRAAVEGVPEALRQAPVIAAAGIGHPERFFRMLEDAGLQVRRLPLADHATLQPPPWPPGSTPVIVTEKDAVKLPAPGPQAPRLYVATLDLSLPAVVVQTLLGWLPPPRPRTAWTTD